MVKPAFKHEYAKQQVMRYGYNTKVRRLTKQYKNVDHQSVAGVAGILLLWAIFYLWIQTSWQEVNSSSV